MTAFTENNLSVSIIIPVKELNQNLKECIDYCLKLDYSNFDIIILPDEDNKNYKFNPPKIKIIPTGNLTPPRKRDFALDKTQADILAFIDDDAYPVKDWLKNALKYFADKDIAAVCGPALTAPSDSLRQKASGEVYESILVSGIQARRYKTSENCFVDDYPSCNFLIRRFDFVSLGGFNTNFWPGEDTFLCAAIKNKLNKKITYDPEVIVYHHRRALFLAHLRQIASYALHRGYFTKRGYNPSFSIIYFLPSVLLIGFAAGLILSVFFVDIRNLFFLALSAYLLLVLIFSISKDLRLISFKFFGIITSHITYGFFFLKGLFQVKLKEE
jgi:GT2 family glycosyltransferase